MGSFRSLLLILLLQMIHVVVYADICRNPTVSDLETHLNLKSAPKLGTKAGKFDQLQGVSDLVTCISKCCADLNCNAALFSQSTCYSIACASDEACSPVKREIDATYVSIRPVGQQKNNQFSDVSTPGELRKVACEVGLDDCGQHEECVPSSVNSFRARYGVCDCVSGFIRDTESNKCVNPPPVISAFGVDSAAIHQTTEAIQHEVPTAGTTKSVGIIPLVVSAGENKILNYPVNSVTLTAFVLPQPSPGETYNYNWKILQHPEGREGVKKPGNDDSILILNQLEPGLYTIKVDVVGPNKAGSATVNVTVVPGLKVNLPPTAVISPALLNIKENTVGILDGSGSHDDSEIVKYVWDIISGPSDGLKFDNNESVMLKLKNSRHGSYIVRLTVTDAQGLKNSTTATVRVEEAVDYPPKANAGDDITVTLPQNSVYLYGNRSSDDKGIASYEWILKSQVKADITGAHEPVLHITNLKEGDYTFQLQVTDTAGQKSTADVHVFVKPSKNQPPKALVAKNITTIVKGADAVLDGRPSTDDQAVVTYQWTQISGPNTAKIENSDRPQANAGGLIVGDYFFKLTVTDAENLSDFTEVKVKVRDHSNEPPTADAGPDVHVKLPVDVVKLDGSKSSDDSGISKYKWTKTENSPAAGRVIDGSDAKPVLMYANVVPGNYTFFLTVSDEDGKISEDSVILHVEPDSELNDTVEISLDGFAETFSERHKKNMLTQLSLLLSTETVTKETRVDIKEIYQDFSSGKLVVLILVHDSEGSGLWKVRNGTSVRKQLKEHFYKSKDLVGFNVANVDTVVCQLTCSGHGYCNQLTKQCVCELLWMANYATMALSGDSNCEWSVLYVVIIVLGGIFVMSMSIWCCVCCSRRCKRIRNKKKHTYRLLKDIEEMERDEKAVKKKKNNINVGNGSIFLSESDATSNDEDTLFISGGKPNESKNLNKPNDTVKANNLKNMRT